MQSCAHAPLPQDVSSSAAHWKGVQTQTCSLAVSPGQVASPCAIDGGASLLSGRRDGAVAAAASGATALQPPSELLASSCSFCEAAVTLLKLNGGRHLQQRQLAAQSWCLRPARASLAFRHCIEHPRTPSRRAIPHACVRAFSSSGTPQPISQATRTPTNANHSCLAKESRRLGHTAAVTRPTNPRTRPSP